MKRKFVTDRDYNTYVHQSREKVNAICVGVKLRSTRVGVIQTLNPRNLVDTKLVFQRLLRMLND